MLFPDITRDETESAAEYVMGSVERRPALQFSTAAGGLDLVGCLECSTPAKVTRRAVLGLTTGLIDADGGSITPADLTVVEAHFTLDAEDEAAVVAIDHAFAGAGYIFGRRLDGTFWHRIDGGPDIPTYADLVKDLKRLAAHVDRQVNEADAAKPGEALEELTTGWPEDRAISDATANTLATWLDQVLSLVDEQNETEEARIDRLITAVKVVERRATALQTLHSRLPVFVYFSNYFRVRPRLHLGHLADRLERNLLDDDLYDRGNACLLKLVAFSARQLSDLGNAVEPDPSNPQARKAYEHQLDKRQYRLNAAGIRLSDQVRKIWRPDPKKAGICLAG